MTYLAPDSEGTLEANTVGLFEELGWQAADCYHETFGPSSLLGRETSEQVVLEGRLRAVLLKLNPGISPLAIDLAVEELSKDRSVLSPVRANQDIYKLLRDGVRVTIRRDDDQESVEIVRVVDWDEPKNNDFFVASQFWISGDYGRKRADLIGFVNGLPLVFIELKASHKSLENAYKYNLSDYRTTIPQIFWHNALIILSNGSKSRVGSMTAGWEHFAEWKKINDEGEEGLVSLETMIRGVCEPSRLLDLVENFNLYSEAEGETTKLLAKNHQFLGVNRAIEATEQIKKNQGKLGVFWHTQGSGKSFSMVFFSQKVLRKIPGNWTFLIVTDRDDLDGQIYRNFASTGAVLEDEKSVRAQSAEHLKTLLNSEDHRYLFTLIQKFRTEEGENYPKLSDRSDIIVITDEAHRSQYDQFALNMRNALPNAAFIGFTGTPLMAGEERTKQVFGDYVSIYNFKQSIDDGNTVPLYYENRIPELQLTNPNLTEDMAEIVDNAELDEDQQRKLERDFAREYQLITRNERLERIAGDIVAHFMGRGVLAKAMVISIDKATTVRMYDKVQKHWKNALARLQKELAAADPADQPELEKRLQFFEQTDMAAVVSQSQNEIEEFKKKGLDIASHRKRMVKEDLEKRFKKSDDPLRIVFVCAMWITGFDVPSCSTIYLDKPMKNHTLMQTVARANRVWREKQNGLIVDYVGIFRDLQKALAIYGTTQGGAKQGELPIKDKLELVKLLRQAIQETTAFCRERGVDLEAIMAAAGFQREKLKEDAVATFVIDDKTRRRFMESAGHVEKLFKSLLPDPAANEFGAIRKVISVIAEKIRSEIPPADIAEVMEKVDELLDKSVSTEGYVIRPSATAQNYIDLSKIDFEALKQKFEKGRKPIEVQKLRGQIAQKLVRMVRLNRTRMNFLEEFQKMIDEYNAGASNLETLFDRLMAFTKRLSEEEKRGISEHLTEEELAVFDLLTKPEMTLTKADERDVKKVAKELLETLKREKLVLDWKKAQTKRAAVLFTIETVLDHDLTGIFCTSGSGREFTLEGSWYAHEEIQAGADRDAAAAG
ncbi:MAG: type I restriction endonuclease subunit R [Candidatus Acidiferrales bacterium]